MGKDLPSDVLPADLAFLPEKPMPEVLALAQRLGMELIPGEPKMLLIGRIRKKFFGMDPHLGKAKTDFTDRDWWAGRRRDYMEDKRWRKLFNANSKYFKRKHVKGFPRPSDYRDNQQP